MRQLHFRHAVLYDIAHCLLDLFPSDADVSEVGPEQSPALFVSWRTSGVANHPGNIAWGVHYRFEPEFLRAYSALAGDAQREACERVRELSRHLRFEYLDPAAVSLFVVDVTADVIHA
ncbi:hypothetical protein B0G84_1658 [Paraburkholderia sp. BL8N3]|jgi:hypothetical protein|nr:hypothetical protein [Paraburkholderia sp. BL8N3]TCK43329.1 hypothetical protein B0G84_1658 [Paraburkholderia sp. BL8N3]